MFGSNDRSPASTMVTRVVEQVVPAVVDSIDADALLARIDVDSIVGRIDLDALMERIDVAGIAQRAEIGELVAQSTSSWGVPCSTSVAAPGRCPRSVS